MIHPKKHTAPPRKDGTAPRKTWEPMKLSYVADIRDIAMPGILKTGISFDGGGPKKPGGSG